MAQLNNTVISAINRDFTFGRAMPYILKTKYERRHNLFLKGLKVTYSYGGEVELPLIGRSEIMNFIKCKKLKSGEKATIIIPLSGCDIHPMEHNFATTFKNIISESHSRVSRAKILSGEIYYIGPGLIMDSNLDPLILHTIKYKLDSKTPAMTPIGINFHIHNKVVLKDTPAAKYIMNNLLPFYASYELENAEEVNKEGAANMCYDFLEFKKKIIFEENFDMMISINKPNVETLDKDAYKALNIYK